MLHAKPHESLLLCVANVLVTAAVVFVICNLGNSVRIGRLFVSLAFVVGLFLVGAFNAYLLDTYKRKNIGMMALVMLGAVHAFLNISSFFPFVAILFLSLLQGVSFALVQVSLGSTLLNDLSQSQQRDSVDRNFALSGKVGWILGLGIMAFCENLPENYYSIETWIPVVGVLIALLLVGSLKVPFRAPLVLPLCSIDRFWFRGESILWISTFLMAGGMGFLLYHLLAFSRLFLFLIMALCALPMFFIRVSKNRRWVACGFLLLVAMLLSERILLSGSFVIKLVIYACSGCSMSLLAVGYLSSFLERADHCQRGTAQHAYMLACESGLIGGLTLADVMPMEYSSFAESLIIMLAILSFLISKHRNQKKN